MISPDLIELLNRVHQYYPIGMPHIHKWYPGIKMLKQINADAVDKAMKEIRTPWDDLVGEVKPFIDPNKYHFIGPTPQFPSYFIEMELEKSTDTELEKARYLIFTISLLCDYYTYFIKDDFHFKEYKENSYRTLIKPRFSIVSKENTKNNRNQELMRLLEEVT